MDKTYTKEDIIEEISLRTGYLSKIVSVILNVFIDVIFDIISNGDTIDIRKGFKISTSVSKFSHYSALLDKRTEESLRAYIKIKPSYYLKRATLRFREKIIKQLIEQNKIIKEDIE